MPIDLEHLDLVPLAAGPVATVLAGVHPDTGEGFALKVFPGGLDRRTRTALDRELSRLSDLPAQAPVLVATSVETSTDGRCALRMELCAQSLTELIESFGPLSVSDTLALGSALATALAAAHRIGVVHGGVTPGNVLFRPSGEPVLSDFGSTLRQAFPRDPTLSVSFTAPETVRDGTVDVRSDLYGLGAVLYLALSGRPPYHGPPGERPGEQLLRVLGAPVPSLDRDDLPPTLAQLVSVLLSKDPQARPGDAGAVAEQLEAMGEPAPASPAPIPPDQEAAVSPPFDDFAGYGAPLVPSTSAQPAPPRPRGEPILVFGLNQRTRRRPRVTQLLVGAAVLALLTAATSLLVLNQPDDVTVSPARAVASTAASAQVRGVQLELADPLDRGSTVELSWRSSESLDFAVIVATEGEPASKPHFVHRNTTYTVPVDPVRRYCFAIQGVNGVQVYESAPKPIRGASCKT
ncbi:MAG TPA: protein kinase [Micromonosporaceae bacterium]|nr:protein kinase [Micromonosporaceae bacterium]